MKVLIDTNVLLSAVLRDRLPEKVVIYVATADHMQWLATPDILEEYLDVLRRPKFQLSNQALSSIESLISSRVVRISTPVEAVLFHRDPKDAIFISAAIMTAADLLITGDSDLLQSKFTMPTEVVSVSVFATRFGIVSG